VRSSAHNFTKENSVVEKEEHAPAHANGQAFFFSREEDSSLPGPKTRLQRIFTRWGYSPSAQPPKQASWPSVQRALGLAENHGCGKPEHLVAKALTSVLAHMEEAIEHEPGPKSEPGKGLAYFEARFKPTLRDLVNADHDDRVAAKRVETLAEIDIKDREIAKAKGQATLDKRIAAGEQAAVKRIEASPSASRPAANGAASAPADRFRDDDKKIGEVHGVWIEGWIGNEILDRLRSEGKAVTINDVKKGIVEASAIFRRPGSPVSDSLKPEATTKAISDWLISCLRKGQFVPPNPHLTRRSDEEDYVWRERVGIEINNGKIAEADARAVGWKPLDKDWKNTWQAARVEPTRLPANACLTHAWGEWAVEKHDLTREQVLAIWERFHRYYTGPDAKNPVSRDWKRKWQDWCDSAVARGDVPKAKVEDLIPSSDEVPEPIRQELMRKLVKEKKISERDALNHGWMGR
jgi:hypothetical protein